MISTQVLTALKRDGKAKAPRYDKTAFGGFGDRAGLVDVEGADVVLVEGWMAGFKPVGAAAARWAAWARCAAVTSRSRCRVQAAAARTKLHGSDAASSWRYDAASSTLAYNCTVPAGVEAELALRGVARLREGGATVWAAADGEAVLAASAGVEGFCHALVASLQLAPRRAQAAGGVEEREGTRLWVGGVDSM